MKIKKIKRGRTTIIIIIIIIIIISIEIKGQFEFPTFSYNDVVFIK